MLTVENDGLKLNDEDGIEKNMIVTKMKPQATAVTPVLLSGTENELTSKVSSTVVLRTGKFFFRYK